MKKNFYRAFEDKYRGSRELIRSRLEVYLDFLMPLESASNLRRAVDLGCGRGEFLEVLSSANYNAQGVDLDDGMLDACYDLKLPAVKADALSFIESLPESSQSVVSAFHLVEHIQFEQLQSLVFQAHRILEPGGLLILETPNPENLIVATKNFYLDPTHQRPIPPQLLAFIADFHGFERVKILRLQESPSLHDARNIGLNDIIGGVSPDYAIVAQKSGPDSVITALNSPFSKDYGITMDALVARYEHLQFDMVSRTTQAEAKAAQAEAKAAQAEARMINLLSSQSWKITAPLRSLNDFVRFHKKRGIRFYCKQSLGRFENFVRRRPVLNNFVLKLLDVFPALRKIIYSPTCHLKKNDNNISLLEIDRFFRRVQDTHAVQKQQHLRNKISCLHLVIDLTPLRPGGENGGIKPYIFECIPWLRKRFQGGLQITFLTSSISHEEVRSKLLGIDDSIVCININSSHHPLEFQARGDRDFLWRSPPSDILWRINADLLYCPFGATTYHCPGIPTIATVVDLLHIDYPAAISSVECSHRDAYFKKMSSDADAFQCISDYGVSRLAEVYNIPTDQIFRTHLALAERFKNSAKPEFHSGSKAFFYPANFWPHKNHLTLLVAYANYVARMGNESWDLILTGFESPEARIVLGYSETLGVKGRVRYEGHVSEERLADIWSSSSALIFPSLHEGFGIPLVEAMSYKLPIICGSTTCLREVAGDAAVLVDASKPMELADAMLRLSKDQELWESLSVNATLRFKAFSFDTEMEKLAQKIELLTKDYPTRVTVSGVDEGRRLAREMFFATSSKGTLQLRTIMKAVGGDARLRLRCGHRFFGSWLLTADQKQIIEVNVFSDGKPFSFEHAPDREFGSSLQFVICHLLSVKNPASHFTEEILPQK